MAAFHFVEWLACSLLISCSLCGSASASRQATEMESMSSELGGALDPRSADVDFVINNRPVVHLARADRFYDQEKKFLSAIKNASHLAEPRALPNALDATGILYYRNGMYSRSLAMFLKAIPLKNGIFSKAEIANGLDSAALAARGAAEYDVAERLYKQALALRREAYGPLSVPVAVSYMNMSFLYSDMSQSDRAAFVETFARKIIYDNKLAGKQASSIVCEPADLICSTRASDWESLDSKMGDLAAGTGWSGRNCQLSERSGGTVQLSSRAVSHTVRTPEPAKRERGSHVVSGG
jgi:tetratricopeptide (TPR) repeat protein